MRLTRFTQVCGAYRYLKKKKVVKRHQRWRGVGQSLLFTPVRHASHNEKHRGPRNQEGQDEKEKTRKMKENQSTGKPD